MRTFAALRRFPSVASILVFSRWQVLQTALRFSGLCVPPCAWGVMWSTSVAVWVQWGPCIWQVWWSRVRIRVFVLRMGSGLFAHRLMGGVSWWGVGLGLLLSHVCVLVLVCECLHVSDMCECLKLCFFCFFVSLFLCGCVRIRTSWISECAHLSEGCFMAG